MSESLTNKLPGAGVQTSYVHSSKIYGVVLVASVHYYNGVSKLFNQTHCQPVYY